MTEQSITEFWAEADQVALEEWQEYCNDPDNHDENGNVIYPTITSAGYDPKYDDPHYIDKASLKEQQQAERRRKLRVLNCGKPAPRLDPTSGRFKWNRLYCGNFRECPHCAKKRADEFRDNVERAVYDQPVWMVHLPDHVADDVCYSAGKTSFKRLPQADQTSVLFIADEAMVEASFLLEEWQPVEVTKLNIDYVHDWETITRTPDGRRTSGSLGKPKPRDKQGTQVKVREILTNAPHATEMKAADMAVEATSSLDPSTPAELQAAIKERQVAFRQAIIDMGYKILVENTYRYTVEITRINWLTGLPKTPLKQPKTG